MRGKLYLQITKDLGDIRFFLPQSTQRTQREEIPSLLSVSSVCSVVEKNMDTTNTLLFVDIACPTAKYLKESPASAKLCGLKFCSGNYSSFPSCGAQHFLYFLPLPHGQGSFRPARGFTIIGCGFSTACEIGSRG
jgi:hypothetical protein